MSGPMRKVARELTSCTAAEESWEIRRSFTGKSNSLGSPSVGSLAVLAVYKIDYSAVAEKPGVRDNFLEKNGGWGEWI